MTEQKRKYNQINKDQKIISYLSEAVSDDLDQEIVYNHKILGCKCFLSPKEVKTDTWESRNGKASLIISVGYLFIKGKWVPIGIPCKTYGRIVLHHLHDAAVKSRSQDIDTGGSLNQYLKEIGVPNNGYGYNSIKEQVKRYATAKISIGWDAKTKNVQLIDEIEIENDGKLVFPKTIRLSKDYYDNLIDHNAIPLDKVALSKIKDSSLELDLYAWLAQRLCLIKRTDGVFLTWKSLYDLFGTGYGRIDNFRSKFLIALKHVKAVYSKAKIDEITAKNGWPRGLKLHSSPPPISPK